ncbi:hypothetical protein RD149_09820 [Gordonia westfalica]|uniref:Bacteriocin biosynthesis cyclodehydratase domain-containing protein n=1 Tax=Gordonia westfalica TaxID=158898 RepID=A0ABU2GRH6_9ACTN|nr:hypothetical protein [Gordonia westfalica]MDS1114068.1 hypothetical protein [Gordonia westfalica]
MSITVPRIRPGTPILVRPGNRVHVGIDPAGSVIIELDAGISAHSVATMLRSLERPCTPELLIRRATAAGLADDEIRTLLDGLAAAGRTVPAPPAESSSESPDLTDFRIQIHGQGPLSDLLGTSLRAQGLHVHRTMRRRADGSLDTVDTRLVILSDFLVHDPRVVFALTRARIPHLLVRVRDGVGIVGPLVLPGLSSCLMCADHHRSDADPEWPMMAVQLIRAPGDPDPAIVRPTAAIAHGQIERLVTGLQRPTPAAARRAPQLLNQVLEFRDDPARVDRREWLPHPSCDCRPAGDEQLKSSIV